MGSLSQAIGPVLQGAGSLASMYGSHIAAEGQVQSANAQAAAATFNAKTALVNADILEGNATRTGQAGDAQAGISEQQTRAQVSGIEANQAAGGIDVNSGSAVGVRESAAGVGMLNALTIRSNAAKQAYSYETQAANQRATAGLDTAEAGYDVAAGNKAAKATILGAAGNATSSFGNYLLQNSLNPGSGSTNGVLTDSGQATEQAIDVSNTTGPLLYQGSQ